MSSFFSDIHEPIYCVDQMQFCKQNTVIGPLIAEMYNMLKFPDEEPDKSWKRKIAEFLLRDNPNLPRITNICNRCLRKNFVETPQQTIITSMKQDREPLRSFRKGLKITPSFHTQDLSADTVDSSLNVTSSSCISCSIFSSQDNLATQQHTYPKKPVEEVITIKTVPLHAPLVIPECVPLEGDVVDTLIDMGEEEEEFAEEEGDEGKPSGYLPPQEVPADEAPKAGEEAPPDDVPPPPAEQEVPPPAEGEPEPEKPSVSEAPEAPAENVADAAPPEPPAAESAPAPEAEEAKEENAAEPPVEEPPPEWIEKELVKAF